jgi:hypothetical protein
MLLQRIDLAYGHSRGCAGEHFNSAAVNKRAKAVSLRAKIGFGERANRIGPMVASRQLG